MGLFDTLYSECEGYLELRAIKKKKVTSDEYFLLTDTLKIKSWIMNHRSSDLYFAVATRTAVGKGTKEDIVHIPALFLDIDFKTVDSGAALKELDAFPLQPTIRVQSGGGLHCYWCLKEPADKSDIPVAEAIMRGLCIRLGGDRAATDASRILRIPNTKNWKYNPPRNVILEHCNGTRYNLHDFDDFVDLPASDTYVPASNAINENLPKIMACLFMQHCEKNAAALDYGSWFAMISQLMHQPGGRTLIHKLSRPYPGYSSKETDAKINNAQDTLIGPTRCEVIQQNLGFECGRDCGVKAPAALAFRQGNFDTSETNDTNGTMIQTGQDDTRLIQDVIQEKLNEADKVRKWIENSDGVFHYTEVARDLQLKSTKNTRNLLTRLLKEHIIERVGTRSGTYQRIDSEFEPTTLFQTESDEYVCTLPLNLSDLVKVQPGNLIIVAGDSNAAKTWFLLEFCRLNLATLKIRYINSEMSDQELNGRLRCYDGNMDLNDWRKVEFGRIEKNYHHHILPNAVTIIDFIDIHSDFYRMGEILKAIHERLGDGICLVAIQKKQGQAVGKGGAVTKEKARLYLGLHLVKRISAPPYIMAHLEKVKISRDPRFNANGLVTSFDVDAESAGVNRYDSWHRPSKEEYKLMAGDMAQEKRSVVVY